MLLTPASIGRKLLLSFASMAGLLILAVSIGTSGFSFVAKTEEKVVDTAIPSMIKAREVANLSSQIISSVRGLADAQNEQERHHAGQQLFDLLQNLLNQIKDLGGESFDSEILNSLESNIQDIIDTIADLGIAVEDILKLDLSIDQQVEEMRQFANELEGLTRTQVSNTSTIAVANITHIYDLVGNSDTEKTFQALDNLIEIDLDLSERLHELHLLAFRMLTQIEESRTVTVLERIRKLGAEFVSNLKIMELRVRSVEDPTRSAQMSVLLRNLKQRGELFSFLKQRYQKRQEAERLKAQTFTQFSKLNKTINLLIDESNASTKQAVDNVRETLNYAKWTLILLSMLGLIAVSFIIWNVVYLSVIKKLNEYSEALRAVLEGKLDFTLHIKGHDELADMGRAISKARDTARELRVVAQSEAEAKQELEEHKLHLEELVNERTRQLVTTNDKLALEAENHAKARAEAEQANRAKTAFLSTMSHEIRTPMNGVLGTASLLKDTELDKQQNQYVDVINRSGSNLLAILNDVLDYSKIEAGHLEIRCAPFSLPDLVSDIFQLLQSRAAEKELGFHYYLESDVAGYWSGDSTRICQVLNNLIGNAIKFTDEGNIDLYVSVDPECESHLLFEVTDTGVGISQEETENLFDAFTQVGNDRSKVGGTGLGLAISKKIIAAMQGELDVDSEPGNGSRFWFSIPLQKAEESVGVKEEQKDNYLCGCQFSARILLVEDNPVNCLVAESFLKNAGHEVDTAINGTEAEALFAECNYDIALLDINLPDCNGVELLHKLRALEDIKGFGTSIPMVAVSAHVFAEEVEGYLASGFNGYLPKPLNKDHLYGLLDNLLNKQELQLTMVTSDKSDEVTENDQVAELQSDYLTTVDMLDAGKSIDNDKPIVNLEILRKDREVLGEEKINDIIRLFISSSAEILVSIETYAEAKEAEQVKQLAHKLKGSAGSMGMCTLHELCLDIESSADPLEKYQQHKSVLGLLVEASVNEIKSALV